MLGVLWDTLQQKQNTGLRLCTERALAWLCTLSKQQAAETVCPLVKRAQPEAGLPQVWLRTENVCPGVCKLTSALTQVQRLNVCSLQGQNPMPSHQGKVLPGWYVLWYLQNYSQKEDPLNPGPSGHLQSPSTK